MQNELQVFNNQEFGDVRVVEVAGEGWLVGKDVAEALGYSNTQKAIRDHVDEEDKLTERIVLSGQNRNVVVINESGLYSLVLSSKLPQAKKFKRWVTSEVLPTIRKHGAYMTEQTLEKALTSPDFLIQLATKLKEEKEARLLAETKLEEARPMIDFAETVAGSSDSIDMAEMAKLCCKEGFKIGRNRLFDFLREQKVLRQNNEPYQRYIENGWFEVEEITKKTPYGDKLFCKTLVKGKGQIGIVEMLKKNDTYKGHVA